MRLNCNGRSFLTPQTRSSRPSSERGSTEIRRHGLSAGQLRGQGDVLARCVIK
jgi:hypothetical protein